uniref:Protein kinase domain-containing protein n=1 Tax=Parascaris univalens TaxID=6257 RepID=A0A915CHE6_PARUN
MSDLLRSAFSYFTQASPTTTVSGCKTDHPLVGTAVEVGGLRLKIRSLLAEGGYALVFSAQDAQGNWFALKRQLAADREAANAIIREIRFLRELTGHPAIIRYVQAAHLGPQESGHGRAEFLMLTELCSGGSVVEFLQKKDFTSSQVMKIFYAACSAVRHMHTRNPPITHRDIKVENLLFDSCGFVKLCDFGSATTETFQPDDLWSALQRTQLEEELARHTTPMYRAPELLDLYSNFPIGPPQDIWALGCILFYLCYRKHPFEDSAKLRIINAKYVLPEVETGYNMFHPLIQTTLQVDPRRRPLASDLCERAGALAAAMGVDLTKPVEGLDLPQLAPTASVNATAGQVQRELASHSTEISKNMQSPRLPSAAAHRADHVHEQTAQQQASAMLGAIKGQGMTWLKNIKDRTTAMAQTVQSTYGGRGPDVSFVTSRLVIAPLAEGIPEALASQAEDAMRLSILEQARGQFAIYNLSQRRLRCDYSNRSSETPMPPLGSGITPTLNMLMSVCRNMALFLRQKATNFVVITGPEAQCVLMASVMLLYSGVVEKPLSAIELVCEKRNIPILPPSYHRQLDILRTIVSTDRENLRAMVHNRRVLLDSILISPTPTFNRSRTGCRPIVEIYSAGNKLWTTGKDYEELQSFELPESSKVDLNLGHVPVADDVQVVVYHARWTKMQNRMQQHLMFSASFHANFIDPHTHILEMGRADLDISPDDEGKFGEPFRVGIRVISKMLDRGF